MAFPQSSHATVDIARSGEWYFCDRCGFRRNKATSAFQWDWRGVKLANLGKLVCTETCYDVAQEQLRTIVIGPDPIPVVDARPGFQASQQGFTPVFTVLEIVDGDILPPPGPSGLADDGGLLILTDPATSGYPTDSTGLAAGAFYTIDGLIAVVPGITPNPSAAPLYFDTIGVTAAGLLAVGGGNLPLMGGVPGKGQLWNNGGLVSVS